MAKSLTGELAYEQTFPGGVRLRERGRYYTQTRASFYSDAYVRAPRGRYFTGDRELSPMHSVMLSMQAIWSPESGDGGSIMGLLSGFTLTLKGDVLRTFFDDFHYDAAAVPNTMALIGSIEAAAVF